MLKRISAAEFGDAKLTHSLDDKTLAQSQAIVDEVRDGGESAIRKFAAQFNERTADQPIVIERRAMEAAAERIDRRRSGVAQTRGQTHR